MMSKRKLIIEGCQDCPHFNDEYYDYAHECTKLNDRTIYVDKSKRVFTYPIPDDCPLEEADDV